VVLFNEWDREIWPKWPFRIRFILSPTGSQRSRVYSSTQAAAAKASDQNLIEGFSGSRSLRPGQLVLKKTILIERAWCYHAY
jgi:hypothetical protein